MLERLSSDSHFWLLQICINYRCKQLCNHGPLIFVKKMLVDMVVDTTASCQNDKDCLINQYFCLEQFNWIGTKHYYNWFVLSFKNAVSVTMLSPFDGNPCLKV